ncbi:IPT/TIG domain-containing protein [Massilia sp. YIM B04103]|uniref:IPT/TIG domain-containing protein n=1 Tax=Massilia sp. YIM B04103 TaxID=2963106 RepID=UPI00210A6120|nr:IPT/TIG domain-containing protein [Massilia sp. YIM B04103]
MRFRSDWRSALFWAQRTSYTLLAVLACAGLGRAAMADDIRYVYDESGRLVQMVVADGSSVEYRYDAVGNIGSVKKLSAATLAITAFSPHSGGAGDTVQIYGSGFDPSPAANTVRFNGVQAQVLSASKVELGVAVPAGASSGKISVANANGTANSVQDYKVGRQGAPTITSFAPTIGERGTVVTIVGSNFAADRAGNKVGFGVMQGNVSSAAPGQLVATAPGNGASGRISVSTVQGRAVSSAEFYAVPHGVNAADIEYTGRLQVGAPPQTVTILNPGKKAMLLFEGNQRDLLFLLAAGGNFAGNVNLNVYRSDGANFFFTSLGANSAVDLPPLLTGATYTLILGPGAGDKGKIDLQLKPEARGVLMLDGDPLPVALTPGQNGRYAFTGRAGQSVGLGFVNVATQPAGQSISYRILNPDGTQLFSDTVSNSNMLPPLPVNGSYALLLDPPGVASASLQLLVSSDLGGQLAANGPALSFNSSRAGQNGRYTFSGTAGQKFWLTFSNVAFPASANVRVLKPDGSTLVGTAVATAPVNLDIPALPDDGVYAVLIDPIGATTGKVDVQLKKVPADYEAALSIDGAPVTLDLAVHQRAMLSFNGAAGQRLGIGYSGVSTTPLYQSMYFTLFKPDGTVLVNESGSSNASTNPPALPVSGVYKLALTGVAPNTALKATVTVSADAPGLLSADAPPLQFISTRPGQNARFTFNGNAGQLLGLTYSASTFSGGATISVLRPDGTSMAQTHSTSSTDIDLPALPVTGSYAVFVDPVNIAVGQANIQLRTLPPDSIGAIAIDGPAVTLNLQLRQKAVLGFEGSAGQRLGLGYTDFSSVPANQMVYYRIYKPDGSQLFSESWNGNYSSDVPALPASGRYTLQVQPAGAASAKVTLALSADVAGTLVQGGPAVRFVSSRAGQNGRFTFAAAAGQTGSLQFSGGTFPSSASVLVFRPDGAIVANTSVGTSGTLNLPASPLAGTYTVFINPPAATSGQVDIQLK